MARRTRDDIDRFFDFNVDMPTRTIHQFDDICDSCSNDLIKALHLLDQTAGPITIRLSTDGGDWYAGMAIFDAIGACTNEVRIVGMGKIMSMGAVILQAADERVLTPNSTLLVHYGSDWFGGHVKDFERRAEESKRANAAMEDIFLAKIRAKHPAYTREDFKTRFSFDVFLSAQEAVDFGLADAIE
jgi:ATP-dependent Clp protease protease subunit